MTRSELEGVLDAILNRADFRDLEVLKAAMERRAGDLNRVGGGLDPRAQAGQMAKAIQSQIGGTKEELDGMVKNLVESLIRQKVPDIPAEHLTQLMEEWMPTTMGKPPRPKPSSLPADALSSMIRDFVAYSTGAMTAVRQVAMNDDMPDWPQVYWNKFPERIRRLIKVFLDGKLPAEVFWDEVRSTLEAGQ